VTDSPAIKRFCSVVVPCYNGLPYTRLFVESLRRNTDYPYELIVVDNGSTDATPEYLASLPAARVVRLEENSGVPEALNRGIEAAQGAYVAVCNNDLILTRGWLGTLVAGLEDSPEAGIVCPADNFIVTSVLPHQFPEERGLVGDWRSCPPDPAAVDAIYPGGLEEFAERMRCRFSGISLPHVNGACMVIRRALIDDIGLFDGSLGRAMYEDVDFVLRTLLNPRHNGVCILPAVYIHHFVSRTLDAEGSDIPAMMRRARENFLRKWPPEQRLALRRIHPQCVDVTPSETEQAGS